MNNILVEKTISVPAAPSSAASESILLAGGSRFSVQAVYTVTSPVSSCTLQFQGSNDGSNWFGLTPDGTIDGGNWNANGGAFSLPITATGQTVGTFPVSTKYVRVLYTLSGGAMTTSNTFVVFGAPI